MFNSVVLDVVIGLVFIYLLYSLLVSIVGEMISSRWQIRANMLKKTIGSMLLDNVEVAPEPSIFNRLWNKIKRPWNKIKRKLNYFLSQTHPDFEYSLAENFYNYPSIKYLGKNEYKNLPSYISKENFSETLFNMLREKGTGVDDMAKIDFCLKYNTLNIDNETKKHITNLFKTADSNPDLFKNSLQNWFDETMDRLNGWYKRRMQVILFWIGFIIALSFNVDSIKIARMLSKDKDARTQMVQMATSLAKDSSRYHEFVVANGDTLPSQAVIDSGYAHITKDISDANLILGLGWKFDKLKKDYQYFLDQKEDIAVIKKIDSINTKLIIPNRISISSLNIKIRKLTDSIYNNRKKRYENESAKPEIKLKLVLSDKDTISIKKSIDTINAQIKFYDDKIATQSSLIRFYTESLSKLKTDQNSLCQRIDSLAGSGFASIDTIYSNLKPYTIKGQRNYCAHEKLFFVISQTFSSWSRLLGFVITALALSLGAPFWFDLLKKLVSIRSSGVKPEEKSKGGNETKPTQPLPAGDEVGLVGVKRNAGASVNPPTQGSESPIEAALRIYGDTIKNIKGVVNVAQGYFKDGDKVLKCIQINVDDQDTAVKVRSLYSQLRVGEDENVNTNVLVTGKPVLFSDNSNFGNKEKGLRNSNRPDSWGSFSCLVRSSYFPEKKYLLTCYHVVNGDKSWDGRPINKTILNYRDETISSNYSGYLNIHQDSALVEIDDKGVLFYKSIKNIRYPKGFKQVSDGDIYTKKVFINGYSTPEASGFITHNQWHETFPYGNRKQKIENLIIISHVDDNGNLSAISTKGDSGALVLDSDDNAIGIVVAGDALHTYAIKLTTIFTELGLELII